jgi:hypothetical protein
MISKIQNLLSEAEAQKASSSPEQSSIASAEKIFSTASEAEIFFGRIKEKLPQIEFWNNKSALNHYTLFNEVGQSSERKAAQVGDFIRISMRGGLKYDWVKIISLDETPEEAVLTVQPSFDPTEKASDKNVTSHFFTDEATNNFCLERKLEAVRFYVIGLNEKSNTGETNNLLESARNFGVANIGSYTGIQTAEWKTFCERFLEIESKE